MRVSMDTGEQRSRCTLLPSQALRGIQTMCISHLCYTNSFSLGVGPAWILATTTSVIVAITVHEEFLFVINQKQGHHDT